MRRKNRNHILRKRTILFIAIVVAAGGIWLNNSSLLSSRLAGSPAVLAHRGLAQDFDRKDLGSDTCTAERMLPPRHPFLENTIPSMETAFALGADALELDVHPTTDGKFAVFHDWTLDCRTEGKGETRAHAMSELKTLDVGYGYTADGGKTFPFRGKGIGMMPSLDEVLQRFPNRRFNINIKSNDPAEGEALAAWLARLAPAERAQPDSLWRRQADRGGQGGAAGHVYAEPRVADPMHPALRSARLERLHSGGVPARHPAHPDQRRPMAMGLA
jgi:glycerophosphoryl diester phosphodiesterase